MKKGTRVFEKTRMLAVIAVLTAVVAAAVCCQPRAAVDGARECPAADSITVVITDSGLGGLSVVADLERKLRESESFAKADLIFFNALFSPEGGYNSLPSRETKVLMFDRALNAIRQVYDPDMVLIACNTLSVLYDDTPFAGEASTPVTGIVDGGVDLIAGCLSADSTCKVIMFGTETTIEEGAHLAGLAELGSPLDRVVTQSCPQLAAYIEQDVDGAATGLLIDAYVTEALAATGDQGADIYVSLNCTHYAYALETWRRAFADQGINVSGFLNPNGTMADIILGAGRPGRYPEGKIRVSVVSMIEIPEEAIASIGGCLKEISPASDEALRDYELRPGLFEWQDLFSVEDLR